MNELESLIILNLIKGLGPIRVKKLMKHFGSPSRVLKASSGQLERIPGIGPMLSAAISHWEDLNYREEFELIRKMKLTILSIFDPDYPENLKEIYDPPPILYLWGKIVPDDRLALSVVGARRASYYGRQTALKISHQLVNHGFTVVSGLARGIDSEAHRGALLGKGRTIAVLGSGLGNIYPPENKKLAARIAAAGAVISEFPIRSRPERTNFPLRNRIISGLSLGVLVVEAGRRSGALITAQQALEQGRSVMAVPGRVDSFSAQGTNELIQEGARMVRNIDDILQELEYLPASDQSGISNTSAPETESSKNLSGPEALVYDLLVEEEKNIEQIIQESGLSPGEVSAVLLSLELKHLVKQLPGKYFIRV